MTTPSLALFLEEDLQILFLICPLHHQLSFSDIAINFYYQSQHVYFSVTLTT